MSLEDKNLPLRRNSNTHQREVEKYIKFFVLKALQAVVSSRTGIHNKTKCNPAAKGQDWFNISLYDSHANRKLQNKIREMFGKKIPTLSGPICLDVVLRTFEGSFIVLETWQLSTDATIKELSHKNHFSIYNRLGVLLKSVLSISRVLPSFNLAKKSEKDFSLFFKVHSELYSLHRYEMHNSISIGNVKTSVGKMNIKVMYRNKVWLSGSFHAHTYTINDADTLLPLSYDKESGNKATFQSMDMFENELASAVSETSTNPEWLNDSISTLSNQSALTRQVNKDKLKPNDDLSVASVGHEDGLRQVAAFAEPYGVDDLTLNTLDLPKLPPTPPFQSLLQDSTLDINTEISRQTFGIEKNDILPKFKELDHDKENKERKASLPRQAEAVGFEDDFVLVELRPAFFSEDDSVGNLYKQCQSPTPLEIFSSLEQEDQQSESMDLDTQLEKYRKDLQEYQEFFNSTLK